MPRLRPILRRTAWSAAFALLLLAAAVGAYLLGWSSYTPQPPDPTAAAPPHPQVATPSPGSGDAASNPSTFTAQARDALRFSAGGLGHAHAVHLYRDAGPGRYPELLAELVAAPDTASNRELTGVLLLNWANHDPAAAFAAAADHLDGQPFFDQLYTLLRIWAARDPAAALAGYRTGVAPRLAGHAYTGAEFNLSGIFNHLAARDFKGALTEYQTLSGEEAKYALRGIASVATRHADDPDYLLPLLDLPGEAQAVAVAQIAENLTRSGDPQRALGFLDGLPVSDDVRGEAEADIVGAWTWDAPVDAAGWAREHPDPRHVATVVRRWADWEPNAAGAWLRDADLTPDQAARAYSSFAVTVSNKDPGSALEWTAAIDDPGRRARTVSLLARQFRHRLVPGAHDLITNSPLTDTEKATLLEGVR